MASALDAADLADRALRAGDTGATGPLGRFERAWRRRLLTEFRLGALLQRFHSRPGLVGLAVARAASSRRWADRFMGLMGHAVPKTEVLRPGFLLDLVRPSGDWPARPSGGAGPARRPG